MTLSVEMGDITAFEVDAIVNAANKTLSVGGGVCGAIHRAAGPRLAAECAGLQGCPTGEARITKGYGLKARYVIHAVGPVWHGGGHGEEHLLRSAYRNSMLMAVENGLKSIAFPAISTGIFGYPIARAAQAAAGECSDFLALQPPGAGVQSVIFVCFSASDVEEYQKWV